MGFLLFTATPSILSLAIHLWLIPLRLSSIVFHKFSLVFSLNSSGYLLFI